MALSDKALRLLLARVISSSPRSREQIADELSERLGHRVTKYMLDGFTSEGKGKPRFPAAWVQAFCQVVADDRLQRFIMGQRLRDLVRLGEVELEKKGLLRTFGHGRDRKKRLSCHK